MEHWKTSGELSRCRAAEANTIQARLKNIYAMQRARLRHNWNYTRWKSSILCNFPGKEVFVLPPTQMVLSTHTVHHLDELSMLEHCLAWGRVGWRLRKPKQMLKQQMMNIFKPADKQKKAVLMFSFIEWVSCNVHPSSLLCYWLLLL